MYAKCAGVFISRGAGAASVAPAFFSFDRTSFYLFLTLSVTCLPNE